MRRNTAEYRLFSPTDVRLRVAVTPPDEICNHVCNVFCNGRAEPKAGFRRMLWIGRQHSADHIPVSALQLVIRRAVGWAEPAKPIIRGLANRRVAALIAIDAPPTSCIFYGLVTFHGLVFGIPAEKTGLQHLPITI
ncbi:MAG: hypothetical protein DM484_17815 [Candidatus Methylumidiphilus alinenensis]|uniref:Uncharacterized protein n=1 Tax=Candidatus Methylumidiphilus alinenensis TaxID=2202197 RepID=A0A2W4SZG6_9GAMM|nr:MAG: hypothetical protein DM484_17815 [Candidatus Methylumidiphilus alinenensis]